MTAKDYVYSKYGTTKISKDNKVVSKILPKLSNEQWYQLMEEFANLNKGNSDSLKRKLVRRNDLYL